MVPPGLVQKQRQQKTAVAAMVAVTATHGILQNRKVFQIA
jgi:hypothetical protein